MALRDLAIEQNDAISLQERKLMSTLAKEYAQVYKGLQGDIEAVTDKIAKAKEAGQDVSPSWLFQQDRYNKLLDQTAVELHKYGQYAGQQITKGQREAIGMAQMHAQALMKAGLGAPPPGVSYAFTRLPTEAVESMVGHSQHDGSPLNHTLSRYPVEVASKVRSKLIQGVALGRGPRDIAADLKRTFGGGMGKYLTVARTEVLGAYRRSTLDTYRENSDVVEGWDWLLGRGDDCAFCVEAESNNPYPLEAEFDSHPNCTCSMRVITKDWKAIVDELGAE